MAKDILPFTKIEEKLAEKVRQRRDGIATRYPLTFALIGTFGLVSTFYGFEKMIDRVDLFTNHPWILLVTGITTLLLTGLAIRKLG